MESPLKTTTDSSILRDAGGAFAWLLLVAVAALPGLATAGAIAQGPAASVNPMIGTGADPDDGINLLPGATLPFGMVQLSPDTEEHGPG